MKNVTHYLAVGALAVWGFVLTPAGQAILMQYPKLSSLFAMVTTILALYHIPTKLPTPKIAPLALIIGCFLCLGTLTGCNATNAAETAAKIIDGIVNIVKVDVPALPPNDAAIATPWANLLVTLDSQLDTCVSQAAAGGGKKATFLVCFNTFAAGATNPNELAQLRVLSPTSQSKAELWATAIILGVNAAVTEWGGQPQPIPVVTSTPASSAELHEFAANLDPELWRSNTVRCKPVTDPALGLTLCQAQ